MITTMVIVPAKANIQRTLVVCGAGAILQLQRVTRDIPKELLTIDMLYLMPTKFSAN